MYISEFSLRNFRNFNKGKLKFNQGINTIIGENGSGKTNLLFALRILLDSNLPRNFRPRATDFSRVLNNWKGHWIILRIKLSDLNPNEQMQTFLIHSLGHMNNQKTGSYTFYFRPKYQIRKKLYELSLDPAKSIEALNEILDEITINDYESIFLACGACDFQEEDIYKKYIGDFESIEFPNPDDKAEDIYGVYLPREINITEEISCTFVKALRDVESDLRSYSNNPLINLLRGKEKQLSISTKDEILNEIKNLNNTISSLSEVKILKSSLEKNLAEAVGGTYAPSLDIQSELPTELDKLFQSLKLWISEPNNIDYKGRISEVSLGGANLIFFALKLLEYEKIKTDKAGNFLFIEEPEAHIHTHIQKTLFSKLNYEKTQIIVSTHSTNISSVSKISHLTVLSCRDKKTEVCDPTQGLSSNQIVRLERYLDAVRSNLLFAKGIILVEGDAEQIIIPNLFKKVFGLSLDELGLSLVNIGSTGFENIAILFNKDRLLKKCSIITDADTSIFKAGSKHCSEKEFKSAIDSQQSGIDRRNKLLDSYRDDEFVNLFFSKHTFEVDFIKGNKEYFIAALDEIYTRQHDKNQSNEKLQNPNIEICGKEALRLAEKEGKGWFALLLVEKIDEYANIPNYILRAIANAASHISLSSINLAIDYRLEIMKKSVDSNLANSVIFVQEKSKKMDTNDKIYFFKQKFPFDQLSVFLNLL